MSRRRSASAHTALPEWTGDMSAARFGEPVMPLTNYMIALAAFFEDAPVCDLKHAIEIRSMACIALALETASHKGLI
jgi:hypothetical protein